MAPNGHGMNRSAAIRRGPFLHFVHRQLEQVVGRRPQLVGSFVVRMLGRVSASTQRIHGSPDDLLFDGMRRAVGSAPFLEEVTGGGH